MSDSGKSEVYEKYVAGTPEEQARLKQERLGETPAAPLSENPTSPTEKTTPVSSSSPLDQSPSSYPTIPENVAASLERSAAKNPPLPTPPTMDRRDFLQQAATGAKLGIAAAGAVIVPKIGLDVAQKGAEAIAELPMAAETTKKNLGQIIRDGLKRIFGRQAEPTLNTSDKIRDEHLRIKSDGPFTNPAPKLVPPAETPKVK